MRLSVQWQGSPDEIGYLLHKNPHKNEHVFDVPYGSMYLEFCGSSTETRMDVYLKVQPELSVIPQAQHPLAAYVSTLPYESGVLMASGLSKVFQTLLKGECKAKPELVETSYSCSIILSGMRCNRQNHAKLFTTTKELGWNADSIGHTEHHMELQVEANEPIYQLFRKLIVLLQAFDGSQHYKKQPQDMEKLVKWCEGWLGQLTYASWIRGRILRDQKLVEAFDEQIGGKEEKSISTVASPEVLVEEADDKPTAYEQRVQVIFDHLKLLQTEHQKTSTDPLKVVDIGGGGGKFIARLMEKFEAENLPVPFFVLVEPDSTERGYARRRLGSALRKKQVEIAYGALGWQLPIPAQKADVYLLIEMIEHLPVDRAYSALQSLLHVQPARIWLTTPNHAYNQVWGWEPGRKRHWDHKQEWNQAGFVSFLNRAIGITTYQNVQMSWIGEVHPDYGGMTLFAKLEGYRTPLFPLAAIPALPSKGGMEALLRTGKSARALPWLPSTIAPVSGSIMETLRHQNPATEWSMLDGVWHPDRCNVHHLLEHPEAAFLYYRSRGVEKVLVETKHMGSRMIAAWNENSLYSRNGRDMLYKPEEKPIKEGILYLVKELSMFLLKKGYTHSPHVVLDGELLPWSVKAGNLLTEVYGPLAEILRTHGYTSSMQDTRQRLAQVQAYDKQLELYGTSGEIEYAVWSAFPNKPDQLGDPTFHDLVQEFIQTKEAELKGFLIGAKLRLIGTPYLVVHLNDPRECQHAIDQWWYSPKVEGIVVKPIIPYTDSMAPMLKVRNPEYLRLIYGPEYPSYLDKLKGRSTGRKMKRSIEQTKWGRKAIQAYLSADRQAQEEAILAILGEEDSDDPRL